ncbi:unnamed protein product [Rotaria sp. Silwood1]|nr:unnamed protein product [Rotaria sp. Silwood1]CAF4799273.1 unnamed protein product [Rotaria sp. Silwood1]
MESAATKKPCIRCTKSGGIITCGGCQQWFCTRHLLEHREELSVQMDQVGQEHDLLQRDLISEKSIHPLVTLINKWEKTSIENIRVAAQDARDDLQKYLDRTNIQVKTTLLSINKELQVSRESDDYTELDLIRWMQQLAELREMLEKPSTIDFIDDDRTQPLIHRIQMKQREATHTLVRRSEKALVRTNAMLSLVNIPHNANWESNGITVAGGNRKGPLSNRLSQPIGLYVDDDQTIYIADYGNHSIVEWKCNATSGKVVAGGNGPGNGINRLNNPTDVIVDNETNSLIICDKGNRRIMQWFRRSGTSGQSIIENIHCSRLVMDDQRFLYVTDNKENAVLRYRMGEKHGQVVAGGNGRGDGLNQLNGPTGIFVDQDYSVYVSDWGNNRVVKWVNGAKEGIVVAGGQNEGNDIARLSRPQGVIVDASGTVYVADGWNNRIMCWCKGATEGIIIAGGNGRGDKANQLHDVMGLSFDRDGNIYVVDQKNYRIQRFNIRINRA